ncbi:hypothetical protein AVEN_53006-1 [Araneus ventricosus]|uniref:Uncharacterized protein n=1 Tax=Araneus ventricosus TaxID=182803 RepID=A0A4Y2TXR1_ARAVE|nr:hypothetical protein AVEN_53006-1 [Araneus ventricosus]
MVNFEYEDISNRMQDSCSIDDKEFKPCYDEIYSHYKKRYTEIVTGMHGQDEGGAFEKARACLEAIVNFCESDPDGCVSVG